MKALDTNFSLKGTTFKQLERVGDVALFLLTSLTGRESYEVIRVRKYPEYTLADTTIGAHESFPPNEAWGDEGWTYNDKADAEHRFLEQAESPYTVVQGTPTGEARGRKRSAFEVELPKAGSEFRIKELQAKYPDQSVPFLHLRVKELMEQGRVEFVRSEKIAGQRGKPSSVYRVTTATVPAGLA